MSERAAPLYWLCLVLSLLCQVSATVLGKMAAQRMGAPTVAAFATNPWYVGGLLLLVLQAFFWQIVLRHIPLFIAYLTTSLSYLLLLAASRFVFEERVSSLHVAGAVLIAAGVTILVRGKEQ